MISGDDGAALAELEQLAKEAGIDLGLPTWDVSGGVGLGAGYRSNVTLSALDPDASAVVRFAADMLAWRLPENGVEWVVFFDGSYEHFLDAETDRAVLTISRGEWRWRAAEGLQWSASLQHVHQDEVIDVSSLEFNDVYYLEAGGAGPVQAQLHQVTAGTRMAWTVGPRWTLRGTARAENSDYAWPLDDFFSFGGELRLERGLKGAGVASIVAGWLGRNYRDRAQAAEGGRPLSDTKLRVQQPRVGLRHTIKGGKAAKWSLQSDLAWLANRDNGSGWYDYDRRSVDLSFELEKGSWSGTLDLGWLHYLYKVQTVGFGDPPPREREAWSVSARVEREMGRGFSLFLETMIDENRSNDLFLAYNDHLVLAGVRWQR